MTICLGALGSQGFSQRDPRYYGHRIAGYDSSRLSFSLAEIIAGGGN